MRRRRRAHLPPFETELVALGDRGVALGVAPDGAPVAVRGAPPGARIVAVPTGRSDGTWTARRTVTIRPPAEGVPPKCAQFGTCGGCTLQELSLGAQRAAKVAHAVRQLGDLTGVTVHPVRGTDAAYGYRNKVELSFGPRRYVSDADRAAGAPIDGRFLGFHAPGRFDRVVDAPRCELVSEAANAVIAAVREVALRADAPPPWDPKERRGFWRHLALREAAGGLLVVVYTSSDGQEAGAADVARIAAALHAGEPGGVAGLQWRVGDHVADVARGELVRSWGADHVEERLRGRRFAIGPTSFFQTNTPATEVLYGTIGEAFGDGAGGRLWDLYCGVGSIGLALADRFAEIRGVEENAEAVRDAEENARRNGVAASFVAARVEDVLPAVAGDAVVVDPPRAGLHPKVAAALAAAPWRSLVYVACHAASLGRDAAVLRDPRAGARLTDVWPVDLFPQTGHLELVARFVR